MLASRLSQAHAFVIDPGHDSGAEDEMQLFVFRGSWHTCPYICSVTIAGQFLSLPGLGMPSLGLTCGTAGTSGTHFNPSVPSPWACRRKRLENSFTVRCPAVRMGSSRLHDGENGDRVVSNLVLFQCSEYSTNVCEFVYSGRL